MTFSATASMRRQVILDTLEDHPWSSAKMLSSVILEESGGAPALITGALWIAPWTLYEDLVKLEREGQIERRTITTRRVWWKVIDRG